MAYKSLEDIIDVIRESVDVIDVMKPIYNFKASDWRRKPSSDLERKNDETKTEAKVFKTEIMRL